MMKAINIFLQEFLDILSRRQRTPGKFVNIEKSQMPQSSSIVDMRTYIDSSFIAELYHEGYQYVPNHSNLCRICLLDLKHEIRTYSNYVDEIEFIYDSDSDMVEERVVSSIPIKEK